MQIQELSNVPELIEEAIQYFWKCWGNDSNYIFYKDCILNSLKPENSLPKFYIGIQNNEIIASYALLTNDIISRQDLMPWFACLFVNEENRNQGLAEELLNHGIEQAKQKGFNHLYLSTDLVNFYERKNWKYFGKGYGVSGGEIKIYSREINDLII